MNKLKLPKIAAIGVGGILSVIVLVMGFSLLQNASSRASDQEPRDVVVSNTSTDGATVSWTTGNKSQGVVEYGITPTDLNLLAPEEKSDISHEVELTLLTSSTTYYFTISVGGKKYDNAGVPWTFSTKGEGGEQDSNPNPSTRPTPISRVVIPNQQNSCGETDCEKIRLSLGNGCSTQDYIKCVKEKAAPTFAPLTTP